MYSLLKLNEIAEKKVSVRIVTHNGLPKHLENLKEIKNFEIFQGDLSDYAVGYGQPRKFTEDKIKTIRLNTMATDILLNKLKNGGKFLFLSTCAVYTGSKDSPQVETSCGLTMPDHPRACYIESKRCGEAICHAWRAIGVTAKIVRMFYMNLLRRHFKNR